ncbi:MAG: hypothetical protein DI570_09325 [Phenylobacterium zucineum]|nr:MAG: hypothetical protein DI570_09325 [Phenylobacterium zucineum]
MTGGPLFDATAFARRLSAAVDVAGGQRATARAAGVSAATVNRACKGWPDLSHENVLRLEAWMDGQHQEQAA